MVHSSVSTINKISQINRESLITHEQRSVPGDVFLNRPNNAGGSGLGGAAPQNLDPAQPNAEDPIELPPLASRAPLEHDFSEVLRWAIGRRFVVCENWGFAVGVGEVMLKDKIRARFGIGK